MHNEVFYLTEEGDLEINAGRRTAEVVVSNTGDRPIQVGSHAHFFEVNKALHFDRVAAFGMRLDIASGTAVRFEPGDTMTVALVEFGGAKRPTGMSGLTDGTSSDEYVRAQAIQKARDLGFITQEHA
nr:J200 [uncultured bacterium]